jgi:threonine dehydrogenase-like Zn-dependent dehydrogenase
MSAFMKTENRPDCMAVRKIEIPLPEESEVLIRVFALLNSGKAKLKPLITQDVSLDDWAKIFTALESGKGVKVVLRP